MPPAPDMDRFTMEAVVDVLIHHPGYHTVVSTATRVLTERKYDDILLWFTTRRSGEHGTLLHRTPGEIKAVERRRRRVNDLLSAGVLYVDHKRNWVGERVHARHQQEITFLTKRVQK
ncbi:MAG: hypothetical protein ACPHID_01970 [Thermoplasmatota archaeon]